jgi:nucleoside-diphosphate-sugar epimerase
VTKTIAVTGGAGFIGGALIDLLLQEGFAVRALARRPEKFAKWRDRVAIVQGDVVDERALRSVVAGAGALIHIAGVTHPRRDEEYLETNVRGAANAAKVAAECGARLVHFSSMSARAPSASPYANSKAASEIAVREHAGANPWFALRVPATYGPRDTATLPYFRMVKSGIAVEPMTEQEARASILYVEDVARAALAATTTNAPSGVYEIGDESSGRTWREIGAALAEALGVKARRLRIPRAPMAAYHGAAMAFDSVMGRTPAFRRGQVSEFFHPDWVAKDRLFSNAADWRPTTPLQEGFAKTVVWYQENGLL